MYLLRWSTPSAPIQSCRNMFDNSEPDMFLTRVTKCAEHGDIYGNVRSLRANGQTSGVWMIQMFGYMHCKQQVLYI
jgi:hypothetical protein